MREQFTRQFQKLPLEGIGVHGTNRAIANIIAAEGFDPRLARAKENFGYYTFFTAQPPNCNTPRATLRALSGRSTINHALDKAVLHSFLAATNPEYAQEDAKLSQEQALVVFVPLKGFTQKELTYYSTPVIRWEPKPIPSYNILGIIDVPNGTTRMNRQLLRAGLNLLKEKGIINTKHS